MDRALDDRIHATIRSDESVSPSSDLNAQKSYALNFVRDSVVIVDNRGHITYLNHAAEQLSGWTSVEVEGRVARTTLFGAGKAFDAAWHEVCDKGEWCGTIAQCTKSGVERLVESLWSAVYEEASSRIAFVLMVSTETSNINLTAADLAHEIRNPLAGIKGVADAFLQRGQLTPQEREWMEAVRHEVMNIDARILELSQPHAFDARPCLLSDLISHVVLLATQSITDRQITVEFIDATTEPLVMALYQTRIEDALLNLMLNAIESIDGSGKVNVCLRRQESATGSEAVIEVSDTGCGIPIDIRERIFEPLFTTKRAGAGLGLAAVRRTAAAHHGLITFKTKIGRGSTFVLTLPLPPQLSLTENRK